MYCYWIGWHACVYFNYNLNTGLGQRNVITTNVMFMNFV